MAIARKPNRKATSAVDVEALINRGGSPGGSGPREVQAKTTPILLRLPAGMGERLDAALKNRPVRLPRHTWILEAIHEKLTRESPPEE
ncbi:MAG TPA: hypothetical protein VMA31_11430 [Bryobacteraceae bacterium]|nr:hypothetical protein [Bryobacteraceae bacterium]